MTASTTTASASAPTASSVQADFPTWLPAMVVKELRQGLRTRGFVGAFIVFQVIMVLLMLTTVLSARVGSANARAGMATAIDGFFWTILGAQLLLATPSRALGTLQLEVESRALDLLMLTRLTSWKIVLGKWSSLMAQALLLFTAMLPYGIVRYFMGSVDLVQDGFRATLFLAGCAVLTAAGLAVSGLPKAVRVLLPIVTIVGFQMMAAMVAGMRRGAFFSGSTFFSGMNASLMALCLFNGACILGIFLVSAVRRIAPPAENHVLLSRGLALLTFVPVPLLAWLGRAGGALAQLQFAGVLLALVAAVELASQRWPMLAHRRRWVARGFIPAGVGRLALPGWPSALLFAGCGVAVIFAVIWLPGLPFRADIAKPCWLLLLGLSGLAFPAVILSFFPARRSPALYGLLLGVFSLCAAIAGVLAESTHTPEILTVANAVPLTNFWITLFAPDTGLPTIRIWQFLFSLAVLGLGWWQSQNYWKQVAAYDAQLRTAKS